MPETVPALMIVMIAVLPGLSYTLAFERQAGSYGVTFADRTLRLLIVSVVFHLIFGWPEFLAYRHVLVDAETLGLAQFAVLWGGTILGTTLPGAAGLVVGGLYATRRTREGWQWLRRTLLRDPGVEQRLLSLLLGSDPAPRAWDDYFSDRPTTYVRVRTNDGTMLGGLFADRSYAAGYPHASDLLLEEAWQISDDGQFEEPLGYALYIAAEQIAWLEFVPQESA